MRPLPYRAAGPVLAIACFLAAAFFFSFWGRNAEGLGLHDMGIALALSFAVPITLYASLACAALAALGAVVSWRRGGPPARWLATLGISLLPVLFLVLVDLF